LYTNLANQFIFFLG